MTVPVAPDSMDGRGKAAAKLARVEGYLALLFVVALFLSPLLPRWPEPFGMAVGISVWACGWLFAISGARRGRGGARVAAVVSLVILVLHAMLVLVIAWH
jgi:hypothetical protein